MHEHMNTSSHKLQEAQKAKISPLPPTPTGHYYHTLKLETKEGEHPTHSLSPHKAHDTSPL